MKNDDTNDILKGLPLWPIRSSRRGDSGQTLDWAQRPPDPIAITEVMSRRPRRRYPKTEPMLRLPGMKFAHAAATQVGETLVAARRKAEPVVRPFVEAGPVPRVVEWLLAGGIAGLMVGWADGYWAATREGLDSLSLAGYRSTIMLAVLMAVIGCSLLALATWPLGSALYRRQLPRKIRMMTRRHWKWLIAFGVTSFAGFLVWAQYVGLQWAAIDIRLPTLIAIDVAVFVAVRHGIQRWSDSALSGGLFALAGVLALMAAGYGAYPDGRSEALTRLAGESAASSKFLAGARFLADGDGDGHPGGLCVEDCDCDDSNATVYPGAREIVDNGIDEDCDGVDETSAQRASYAALLRTVPTPDVEDIVGNDRDEDASDVLDLETVDAREDRRPNIVFIVVDTLRADHLGVYGYDRPVSRHIDALAAKGMVFEQARSAGPQTRFSVPAMLTGKYFTEIERTTGGWPAIRLKETLVAERLAKLGYQTAAFHSIAYFKRWSGMAQGMDVHSVRCAKGRTERTSDCVTDEVLKWAGAARDEQRPTFLWAYYGDPHAPYLRHRESPNFGSKPKDIYDQEIHFTDQHLGRLFAGLAERGLTTDNTYFVLTSDHGEGLDELEDHGHRYHGATLFDEVIRVPLIVAGPGIQSGRARTSVSLVDLTPTFMHFAGVRGSELTREGFRGVSLMPWLLGETSHPHGPVFFEKHKADALPQKGMVMWPYKVILVLPYMKLKIYNLAKDPRERVNLKDQLPPEQVKKLVGTLKFWMNEGLSPVEPVAPTGNGFETP